MSKKWAVICPVGMQSVHRLWNTHDKDFDTFLICYDERAYEQFKNDLGHVRFKVGKKYRLCRQFIIDTHLNDKYDYFLFIDDDCVTTAADINGLFAVMQSDGFKVLHPAIEPKYNINTMIHPNYETEYRVTNWSEISSLFMSKEYLNEVIDLFDTNESGWGLPELFFNRTQTPFIIYDAITVQDGRPLHGGYMPLYDTLEGAYKECAEAVDGIQYEHKVLGFKLKNLLSFCIIYDTNKAHYIPDCIGSLPKDSEIVLVETIQDAEKEGIEDVKTTNNHIYAKYYYKDWNYSDARNACKALATRPVIFSIDSDERLAEYQHTAIIKAALDLYKSEFVGLKVRNISIAPVPTLPGNYAATTTEQIRIFRNIPQLRWQAAVHENIEMSMQEAGLQYADSNILIHHIGYETDVVTLRDKHLNRLKMLINDDNYRNNPNYLQYIINESMNFKYYHDITKGESV